MPIEAIDKALVFALGFSRLSRNYRRVERYFTETQRSAANRASTSRWPTARRSNRAKRKGARRLQSAAEPWRWKRRMRFSEVARARSKHATGSTTYTFVGVTWADQRSQ